MPSIPIQLGDLLMLATMASKACEHMDYLVGGLAQAEKEVEVQEILGTWNDCIRVLGELDRKNPGLMPVPHNGVTWAERAAAQGEEEDEPTEAH